jgi:hypothetical protein
MGGAIMLLDVAPIMMKIIYEKWRSPLFGATCNFNDQILPYDILFLTFINTNVFYLLSFKFSIPPSKKIPINSFVL